MVFLKYFLLNFLYLFSDELSFTNVAIFSFVSLIFVLIIEIRENFYSSTVLSVVFLIVISLLFMQYIVNQFTIFLYFLYF